MTSILKSPMLSSATAIVKSRPTRTSTPTSASRNPPALSLLKAPPGLTPLSPISADTSRSQSFSNPQVLGTVESVQAQAKAAMSLIGSIQRDSVVGHFVRDAKVTPPPKLHPIHDKMKLQESPKLCQIENVTSLVNGEMSDPKLQHDASGNDSEKFNEEIETLSSNGSIFGLMRAFYTVTVPDHKPSAYKQFFCNFCKCKTWDQQVFLDHITTHLFVCGRCSFRSFSRADVVSHIIKKHPDDKGELPSLHAMHLENVNLQFNGSKDSGKASVSNALAGSDITKVRKEDCQPVVVGSSKGSGQHEFQDYLEKNVKLGENEMVYVPPDKDDDDDDVIMQDDDDTRNSSAMSASPPKLDEIDRSTPPLKELGSITAPNLSLLTKMGSENRLMVEKPRMQYQCTNCDFGADSIECVKEHFIKIHSGKSHSIGYKSLPMKYYSLICPYCMLQMHDPEEMDHHLHLRHNEMYRKLVIALRPVPSGLYTYVCSQCGASSPVKENMLGHILLEHETEHLLDALLYIYKAGVQRFIEHVRELIRQTFNYEQFTFPDMPESLQDPTDDFDGSQGSSSILSQDDLEFVVLHDDPPKLDQDGMPSNRGRSPTRVKVMQHYDSNSSWSSAKSVPRAPKCDSPIPGPKTKDLPEAEVMFLEETPPELLMDPRPHYNFNPTLKRASCKKCAFVTYGTNAQTHVREHVIGIHFRGRIWGCPYCTSLRMRRAEIIRHVVSSHPEMPVKIVRRKPYEQHASLSTVMSKKTLVTSRVNSPARERLECWQCPFCLRRDASWSTMVRHLRFVHIDQEFKPVKWLRPTPKVKLEKTPELIQEVAKMKPYIFSVRVEDMERYPVLSEVLDMEDSMHPEPSRTLMLNEPSSNKQHKFGCKICDYTFASVQEIKSHLFAYHPGEELAIRDFRASKAPKGKTETTLFLCPGCQFTTKMVKALQVHSIKFPAHFSNIRRTASPPSTEDHARGVRSQEEPSRGVKRKATARKSTAKPRQPPEKKQKTSRMCARKSTAKAHKSKASSVSNNSNIILVPDKDVNEKEPIIPRSIPTVVERDNKKIELNAADKKLEKSVPTIVSPEIKKTETKKTKKTKPQLETTQEISPIKAALDTSTEMAGNSNITTEEPPQNETKEKVKVKVESADAVDFPTDHLSLRCSICQSHCSTGVPGMKKHIVKKHYTLVPVAIDLVAKEAKKPQRLHICTLKGCPYVTYREWEFKAHIQNRHGEAQFGFDVSLLHDGHVIRRNLWKSMPQGVMPKKNLPVRTVAERMKLSEFTRRRHEFSRSRRRNSENEPSPGDRRSERVTRNNSRLSSSGEDVNDSMVSNVTTTSERDRETDTDSEKDSEIEEEEGDETKNEIMEDIQSPQPPDRADPVHEPGGEGSEQSSRKKKKSKKKKVPTATLR